MGNKASKTKKEVKSVYYNKHRPIEAYTNQDPRTDLLRVSREYIQKIATNGEKIAYGEGVADVSSFSTALESCKSMSLPDFLKFSAEKEDKYITKISFNPTEATYFDMFMDKSKRPLSDHYIPDDFSLSAAQRDAFKRNGFVVTQSDISFAAAYYKIYNNDLPVLITTDSILHAFHIPYDAILKELEAEYCLHALKQILVGMLEEIKKVESKFTEGPFKRSIKDTDFFLTVALNLLSGEEFTTEPSVPSPSPARYYPRSASPLPIQMIKPIFGADSDVANALKMCKEEKMLEIELFGKDRTIDFTLFKPRGHYAPLPALRQYFRAMMWLGKIDMTVAGEGSNMQQLGSAILLHMLLTQNKEIEDSFHVFNRIVESLVGPVNSLDVNHLGLLLDKIFKMKDYTSINSEEALAKLHDQILGTDFGNKKYNNGPWRSFTFMGQRFSIDSWAQSKLVTNDDVPGANVIHWQDEIVPRHTTSAVEVAFSVLGNNDAVPVIHQRITDTNSKYKFRDGLVYHPYLVAARNTIDDLPQEAWCSSIYMFWLAALRKLSAPLDHKHPQAMRTQAYAMKKMNTQLASWAQLRHDNMLYVDQFGRCMASCDYPDGFVEPLVDFWVAMEKLCMASAEVLRKASEQMAKGQNRAEFFVKFARHISIKELHQEPLDADQQVFIKTIVEKEEVGSGGDTQWTGWYPSLFYGGEEDVEASDMIVCDVFSNPPSLKDPGCVVHQGLGRPRRMLMAVDNGGSLTAYAGPVFDYYEFELEGLQRLNDEEWEKRMMDGTAPQPPEWTSSYLVKK